MTLTGGRVDRLGGFHTPQTPGGIFGEEKAEFYLIFRDLTAAQVDVERA